ncbi:nuclease EXOG, mitochondrial-like, partial [Pocillopora damicornis]|uniref:nuclease EXOG, mitochondrial-like n=1 Tax=Pocillopora damicornis TaxID=46731 RepID=UPI000F54CF31
MKTTTVWCLVIAISVLAVTESSKRNSTGESPNKGKRFLWGGPPPFFVGGKRPVGLPDINRGTEIQQGTPPSFVSLFDPTTNTPFYSAYKVLPAQAARLGTHKRPKQNWSDPPGVPGVDDAYKQANVEAQNKYGNQITRGHMNPSGINSFDKTYMKNTFTLANAVPQFEASNSGPWSDFENKIKDYAHKTCGSKTRQGTLYLLTGRSENG